MKNCRISLKGILAFLVSLACLVIFITALAHSREIDNQTKLFLEAPTLQKSCEALVEQQTVENFKFVEDLPITPQTIEPLGVSGWPGSGWVEDRLVYYDPSNDEKCPSMATDSRGRLYVAYEHWFDSVGRWGIIVSRSTDGGNSWSFFEGWYSVSHNMYYPSIAIDPFDDRIYVACELEYTSSNYDVYCMVYTPGSGWAWVTVDNDTDNDRYPSITSEYQYGGANWQYISYEYVYSDDDRDLMFAKSTDHGTSWSLKKLHGDWPDNSKYTQTSITNAEGYIYIAYQHIEYHLEPWIPPSTEDIQLDRSSDFGNSWTQYTDIDGADLNKYVRRPSVAATHGGSTVIVAFRFAVDAYAYDVWYSYSQDNGGTWNKLLGLFTSSFHEQTPALSVDGGGSTSVSIYGYIHAVCYATSVVGEPRETRILYRKAHYSTPTSWSSVQTVSNELSVESMDEVMRARAPAITTQYRVVTDSYYPCVAWRRCDLLSYDILYSTPGANYTIASNPTGRTVEVDGFSYTAPKSFSWIAGSAHTITAPSPQYADSDTRYIFSSWSDGGSQSHAVTVGDTDTTVTAYYNTEYRLYIATNRGTTNPSWGEHWYSPGTNVEISATPPSAGLGERYEWNGWTGSGSGSYTGLSNPVTIVMDGPITEIASWTLQYYVTIQQSGSAVTVTATVDRINYNLPFSFWWDEWSHHSVSVPSTISGGKGTGVQYKFIIWSDGDMDSSRTIVVAGPYTYTAQYATQYLLTMRTNFGTVSPGSGWHDENEEIQISATPPTAGAGERYVWQGWTGTGPSSYTGMDNPAYITMTGPITEEAKYDHEYYVSIQQSGCGTTLIASIDGVNYILPIDFWWKECYSHTISVPPIINDPSWPEKRYVFTQWSGLISSSVNPITFHLGTTGTITANYKTEYNVTFHQSGSGATVPATIDASSYDLPVSFWWDEFSYHSVSVPPTVPGETGVQYKFIIWSDGDKNPSRTIYVTSPKMYTALYNPQYQVTFTQSGSGGSPHVTVDGTQYLLPCSFWWDAGSHTFSYEDLVSGGTGVRYILTSVSHASPITVTNTMTITGYYMTQYYLTVRTDPPDLIPQPTVDPPIEDFWYVDGTPVTCTAQSVTGWEFGNWTVDGICQGQGFNPIEIIMDGPHDAIARYTKVIEIIKTSVHIAGKDYTITIESNTTLTDVLATRNTLHFKTSGPEGTPAYINVTLPVGLNTTEIKVFVDGKKLEPPPFPIITTNSTHYFIYFEFIQSEHYMRIQYAIADIAITSITPSKTVVGQGFTLTVHVTIQNQGNYTENFNTTVYAQRNPTSQELETFWSMGDVNRDGFIDPIDIELIYASWYSTLGEPHWNQDADLNKDLIVNEIDLELCLKNQGLDIWTFFSLYPTPIGTLEVTNLLNGTSKTITFTWNTTVWSKGNYFIWACAWPVLGETDTTDNTFTNGVVAITIPGDIDGDFRVSYKDLFAFAAAYGSQPGDLNWNPNCDIDGDNRVSYKDLFILAAHYGEKYL